MLRWREDDGRVRQVSSLCFCVYAPNEGAFTAQTSSISRGGIENVLCYCSCLRQRPFDNLQRHLAHLMSYRVGLYLRPQLAAGADAADPGDALKLLL